MGLFDIGRVGVPVLLIGLLYVVIASERLLPDNTTIVASLQRPKEYMTSLVVKGPDPPSAGLGGKTIAEAGLRNLPGLYLVQIERQNGDILSAPSPATVLQPRDKLLFAGVVDSVLSLTQVPGLVVVEEKNAEDIDLYTLHRDDVLVEAVVAPRSELVHHTVRDLSFRSVDGMHASYRVYWLFCLHSLLVLATSLALNL